MRIGSYSVKNVTYKATALGTAQEVKVGDKDMILWEFEISTTGDKDNIFKAVTLRNNGWANLESSLSNLFLFKDGKKVSTETVISGREVTFIVNDTIENSRSERYEVRADVISTERDGDDVQFELRNDSDLTVIELATSFSAPVSYDASNTTGIMTKYEFKGGELLLSRDTSVINTKTVSASTTDVILLSANISVNESVTVEDLFMKYNTTTSGLFQQYRDLKLVVDGRTISTFTPTDVAPHNAAWNGSFTFDGSFTIKDKSNVKVLWNLRNTASNGSILELAPFKIELGSAAADVTVKDVRYVSNDERPVIATNHFGITGVAQAVRVTVAEASLLITRNDGLNNDAIVSGSRNVTVLGFSLRANDVSDLRVTSLNPSVLNNGTAVSIANITNVRLYEGETLISTRSDFNFSSLNINIPKNSAKSFKIVADFNTSVVNPQTIRLALIDSTNISVRNVESNQTLWNANITWVTWVTYSFNNSWVVVVSPNSSTRTASILTPSNTQNDVFTFDLEAKNDKLRLTDLYVNNTAAHSTLDLANSVNSVSLVVGGRTIEGAAVSANVIYFPIGDSNPIIIERDETVKLEVRVSFNDSTDRTARTFQLALWNTGYTPVSGTTQGLRLLSDSTGQQLVNANINNDVAIAFSSQVHLLARSKPVVAVDTNVSGNTLYKFTVTADSNRYVDLKSVALAVNSINGVGYSSIKLTKDSTTGTEIGTFAAAWTAVPAAANEAGTIGAFTLTAPYDTTGFRINAGETVTFYVTATVNDNFRTTTYTRQLDLTNVNYNDSVWADITTASDYNNVGLPAQTVSTTVTK